MERCVFFKEYPQENPDDSSSYPIQTCSCGEYVRVCSCYGDSDKCNFYPEKRKKNKDMNTVEMIIQATKNGKTYKTDDMKYNSTLGFHDIKGRKWNEDVFKYVNDIFAVNSWQLKPDNEMTKSEAEARFNIKIVGD